MSVSARSFAFLALLGLFYFLLSVAAYMLFGKAWDFSLFSEPALLKLAINFASPYGAWKFSRPRKRKKRESCPCQQEDPYIVTRRHYGPD